MTKAVLATRNMSKRGKKQSKQGTPNNRQRIRLCRARLGGNFKSTCHSYRDGVSNSKDARTKVRRVQRCIQKVLKYIHGTFCDVMKLPGQSKIPRPALLWPSGPNIYFGQNFGDKINGHVARYAYALGSGTNTIGINPAEYTVHPWNDELQDLLDEVRPCLPQEIACTPWNAASMKFYDSFEYQGTTMNVSCGFHRDMQYKINGEVADQSSQRPDTPVLIITYGGSKYLSFKKIFDDMDDTDKKRATVHHKLRQTDSTCIVLHPDDEKWTEEQNGSYYCYYHGSEYLDQPGNETNRKDMIVTIMFRCVQKIVTVGTDNHPIDSSESQLFRIHRKKWSQQPHLAKMHETRKQQWLEKLEYLANKKIN